MKEKNLSVPADSVLVMRRSGHAKGVTVGSSWQPEVAQFLLDMYPDALENGLQLEDLYHMVASQEANIMDLLGGKEQPQMQFFTGDDDEDDE